MGEAYIKTIFGSDIHTRILFMGQSISNLLNVKYMLVQYWNRFKSIIIMDKNYGYKALYNIMGVVIPIIMQDTVEFQNP